MLGYMVTEVSEIKPSCYCFITQSCMYMVIIIKTRGHTHAQISQRTEASRGLDLCFACITIRLKVGKLDIKRFEVIVKELELSRTYTHAVE